jgi:hypothetical protein
MKMLTTYLKHYRFSDLSTGGMMKRPRFSAEQLIRLVQAAEALGHVRAVWRRHQSAAQTRSRGRRQGGGLDVSDATPRRALARENAALKRLVGARTLGHRRLQDGLGKPW